MAAANAATREYIRYEVIDMNCKALSKTVPARHRSTPVFMYSGAVAMGANSEVLTFPEEVENAGCPNCKLLPDWSTEQVLPWACRPGAVVRRVFCEQARPGATGLHACSDKNAAIPRTVCLKLLDELRSFGGHGYELLVGGELEFTVAKPRSEGGWAPYFDGVDIFATLQNAKAMDFCYEVERSMEPVGVDILTMNAEYGEGQLEIAFAPKFGVEACDMTATFRTGTKEIAQSKGLLASFISRPWGVSGVGNGGHLNFSLWVPDCYGNHAVSSRDDVFSRVTKGRINAFHSAADSQGLSETAKNFLAGVLAHAPALEAVCAPTPGCYTRHGNWAPVVANWGPEDRTACVRVKADKAGDPASCYMELRMPSASANPYLVVAALVAAGLDGLERKLELPAARQTKDDGIAEIPKTLGDAIAALEADKYMVEKLGSDFVRWYKQVKEGELKHIEERLAKGSRSDREVSEAWQHMYLEYV